MRIRFSMWLALGVAAAFLVVATTAFALADIPAVALGVGIGMLVVSASVAYLYRDHIPSAAAALWVALVSAWTIVASQVFSATTVQTLAFASGLAVSGLALIGLTAHELSTERVVHSLEVDAGAIDRERTPIAA